MNPFGELGVEISPSELRETAYEILIGACRSSGSGRPLTYVSSSKNGNKGSGKNLLLQKSTSLGVSKVKKALGLKPKKSSGDKDDSGTSTSTSTGVGTGELMRIQMRVSENTDSRVRRSFLRLAAAQLGRRIESLVLPLEFLQVVRGSDFASQKEYEAWQRRNLKILEAGLIVHPQLPLDNSQTTPKQFVQILRSVSNKSIDTVKNSELMQNFHNVVMSLACRSFDGSASGTCHWADGIPLNLHLYLILLEACFDVNDEGSVIEEVDEVLEQIKKTWVILGMDEALHNLCFFWVLIHRYIVSGESEGDLLLAANNMMAQVAKDVKVIHDAEYKKVINSVLTLVLEWSEKMLRHYHDIFYRGNIDMMQNILSFGVSAATILAEGNKKWKGVDVSVDKVESYIRSSLQNAFAQEKNRLITSRKSSKSHTSSLPLLSILAQNTCDMAFNEKEIYSPLLKTWHPLATGVAVATLHACYAKELNRFVSNISELNPEAIQVLLAADKLEKELVEMAVADSVDSDDGGKSIIQEMVPYESEAVIANLVKAWIQTRVDRLKEWVDRSLQHEEWNPQVNKGRFTPSAVEVLRIMDETLEAFFLLPIPMHPVLLPELMGGFDKSIENFVSKAKSGCGSRSNFVPTLPALTRCNPGSKLGAFRRKEPSLTGPGRKSKVYNKNADNSYNVPRLCLRINTMYYIRKELEALERRVVSNLKNIGFANDENVSHVKFELSIRSCMEGISQISEATSYKVVFSDLSDVLWDYLYTGEASSTRIEPFLQGLEQNLEVISSTVHDRVRTRVITDVMKASFEGFLLVLLAGGPSRGFSSHDYAVIYEDFKYLKDLFWSNGDGLPNDLIDKYSATINSVLPLYRTGTEELIEQFKGALRDGNGVLAKSRIQIPQTTGRWGPSDPNTVLRVLCHRKDKIASKFLKKTFDLPKRN